MQAGIEQLFNQLMRPKLRNLVQDVYTNMSYALDEDGYAQAEYQDLVRKRFVKAWEGLVEGYKVRVATVLPAAPCLKQYTQDIFTESNYRLFFGLALDVLLKPWEKFVLGLKYTEVCIPVLCALRIIHLTVVC